MNFHKAINFTKQMAVLLAAVLIISSCGKEQAEEFAAVAPEVDTEKTVADYPEAITLENWETFVNAPASVIQHFAQKERAAMENLTENTANEFESDSRFPFTLGLVEGFNGAWVSMPGVNVSISGSGCGASSTTNTWTGFNYFISTSCSGPLCMAYATGATNGVSGLDLVLTQRHILGLTPFTTAQQFLAADANRDGSIDAADITLIQQVILAILPGFPGENVVFTMLQDYNDVQTDIDNTGTVAPIFLSAVGNIGNCLAPFFADRRAIKTGDVSGNFSF